MTGRVTMPVIGLVGGVGAGKSTAADQFAALGCTLIDADKIGHELLADEEVCRELRSRWGERVFRSDGFVDRAALADIVFKHSSELDALNQIMHPRIGGRIARRIEQAQRDCEVPAVVLDAATLFEAGWDNMCTHVVFVAAPHDRRVSGAASKGMDRQEWLLREKSQISLDNKRAKCYCTLDNSSSVSHLCEQVRRVFQRVVHQADRP